MKWFLPVLFILPLLTACSGVEITPQAALPGDLSQIELTSPAFRSGEAIPKIYSCQGEDTSPTLQWSAPPQGTKSLAMIMDDPDAPGKTWVHWVIYNLPPDIAGLEERASTAKGENNLPQGVKPGKNSWGREDYGGPCPPTGTHRYIFHLYALDTVIEEKNLDKTGLLKAIDGHILGQGELIGTYAK